MNSFTQFFKDFYCRPRRSISQYTSFWWLHVSLRLRYVICYNTPPQSFSYDNIYHWIVFEDSCTENWSTLLANNLKFYYYRSNRLTVPGPANLLKKRLWHRCFPVNFAKFLRTPFFTDHLWWLLLLIFNFLYIPRILLTFSKKSFQNFQKSLVFQRKTLNRLNLFCVKIKYFLQSLLYQAYQCHDILTSSCFGNFHPYFLEFLNLKVH